KNIVSREICLDDSDVELATNFKHDGPRNSLQCSGRDWWREDLAVLDDEDIVGSAFGDISCVVQHQCFISAGKVGFDPGHYVVQVVQRFNSRIERCRITAAGRDSNNAESLSVKVLVIMSDRRHNYYHAGIFALLR